jgi:hypothetical protein
LIFVASLIFCSLGAESTVFVLLASVWISQFLAVRIAFHLVSLDPLYPPIEAQVLNWLSPILWVRKRQWLWGR